MTKFWITIALLLSLIAPSAMVNAMPSKAMDYSQNTHGMQIHTSDSDMKCAMPDCPSDDCMQHCKDSLSSHCHSHCLGQLFLSPEHQYLPPITNIHSSVATQSWAVQTAELGLTTPPPNSNLL